MQWKFLASLEGSSMQLCAAESPSRGLIAPLGQQRRMSSCTPARSAKSLCFWLVEDWQEQEVSKVMAKVRHLSVNVQQQPDRFNVVAGFRTAAPTEELCFVKVHLEMDGLRLLATN